MDEEEEEEEAYEENADADYEEPDESAVDVDEDKAEADEEALKARREANIRALVGGSLQVRRAPLLSRILRVQEGEVLLRRSFKSPAPGVPAQSAALKQKLLARKRFVPWGEQQPFTLPSSVRSLLAQQEVPGSGAAEEKGGAPPVDESLPEGVEPLVLWEAPSSGGGRQQPGGPAASSSNANAVVVDPVLTRWLRPHQREGVAFMFECVAGLRSEGGQHRGCILADDMGLGKTLQAISLLWTLLRSGHHLLGGCPLAKRAIIVCPTSLVSNWESECTKWLRSAGRTIRTLALAESCREDVLQGIASYLAPSAPLQVLIISYETFRTHAARFSTTPAACDLLICDEAHRLKNAGTLTNSALASLECKRRVLLSGTPMQNHLDEFYAMCDFCNPGVLGSPASFHKRYEAPILAGREPGASPHAVAAGEERSAELSALVNAFILRRTNTLLSAHLPPKVVQVVCCRPSALQHALYCRFLESKAAAHLLSGRATGVLSAITSLKKLCNHPKLIYDELQARARGIHAGKGGGSGAAAAAEEALAEGLADMASMLPADMFLERGGSRGGGGGMAAGWEALSGKMALVGRMLHLLWTQSSDRIVIVSNYTQTLDLLASLCRERGYPALRLDGSTSIAKRQKLVQAFCDPQQRQFVFLLSSKAGGCGLNLVGANRLILFDPDWNPANDKQAAGRVWRDGQRKRVYVYRFLTSGTIEEKVFQRQLSKEGLQSLVAAQGGSGGGGGSGRAAANLMSTEELRELFSLDPNTASNTYDSMCGGGGGGSGSAAPAQVPQAEAGSDCDAAAAAALTEERPAAAPDKAVCSSSGSRSGSGASSLATYKAQVGTPAEEDLRSWGHHGSAATVPDELMQRAAGDDVSFIFSCQFEGRPVEDAPLQLQQRGQPMGHHQRGGRQAGQQQPGAARRPRLHADAGAAKVPLAPLAANLTVGRAAAGPAAAAAGPAAAAGQAASGAVGVKSIPSSIPTATLKRPRADDEPPPDIQRLAPVSLDIDSDDDFV